MSTHQFAIYMATAVTAAHAGCMAVAVAFMGFTSIHNSLALIGLVVYSLGLALFALPTFMLMAAWPIHRFATVRVTFLFFSLSVFVVIATAPGFIYATNKPLFLVMSFALGIAGIVVGHMLTLRAIRTGAILMRLRER